MSWRLAHFPSEHNPTISVDQHQDREDGRAGLDGLPHDRRRLQEQALPPAPRPLRRDDGRGRPEEGHPEGKEGGGRRRVPVDDDGVMEVHICDRFGVGCISAQGCSKLWVHMY